MRAARPTAVNLAWAVDRVLAASDPLHEARTIHQEQIAIDAAIARHGLELVGKGARVLTHCNTGPLATAGGGTATGVIVAAQRGGKKPRVYVDETRPLLQGARLNYMELRDAGVDAVLLVDSAAAIAMKEERIDLVIVGADRIVRNGDTANKIGTYALAILAAHHGIPFYVAAPRSTFDLRTENGAAIPIEQRDAAEVAAFAGTRDGARRRRGLQSGLRRDAGTPRHRLRHGVRHPAAAVRRIDSGARVCAPHSGARAADVLKVYDFLDRGPAIGKLVVIEGTERALAERALEVLLDRAAAAGSSRSQSRTFVG